MPWKKLALICVCAGFWAAQGAAQENIPAAPPENSPKPAISAPVAPDGRSTVTPAVKKSHFKSLVNAFRHEKSDIKTVSVNKFFDPNTPNHATTRHLIEFMRHNPDIKITQWGGISLPGGKSGLMMSIAGNTAPDIGESWFHLIRNEIKQSFLYPLNEWVGYDTNGNGQIDDDEAKWEGWKKIPPIMRRVCTVNGKVYGIPQPVKCMMGVIYRIDMVEAAGLDPNKPPQTWSEYLYWCRKLTNAKKKIPGAITQVGQKGTLLSIAGFVYLPWIQSAGGEPIVQIKRSPVTGKDYKFAQDEVNFVTPEGEDLSAQPSDWRCNFDSPEALAAADLYYELRWGKFIFVNGEPVSLKEAQEKGIPYKESDVIQGAARAETGQPGEANTDLLSRGEVAMVVTMIEDLVNFSQSLNIDPALLSWFPIPAADTPHGRKVVQTQNHYAVMYPGVAKRPKAERDAVWKVLTAVCDNNIVDKDISSKVLSGFGCFVPPDDLKRMGYDEYIRDIPQAIQKNFDDIKAGNISAFTEPWNGYWFIIDLAFRSECFGIMLKSNGEHFDYREAIRQVNNSANQGLMFDTPEETLAKYRPVAFALLVVVVIMVLFLAYKIIRSFTIVRKGGSRSVYKGYLPWLILSPAVILILLWQYYPLARGMVMAFQDYKVTGDSVMVGLDNFINLCIDSSFWMSLLRTIYFVFLNILLAFFTPIILAILLTEIRHFKIFYRTLFFLPQMTSGLVIALMWKLMYNPTPAGFFNQLLTYINYLPFVDIPTQTWLEDPKLAMICCIIPSVWAGMGMGSLLYLAALHSIPPDLYEAADIDGAGVWNKLVHITIPTLMPLIIISFVGTFIATFQNMGNIFLMTFGGPGQATTVIGLKIWQEAYVNLRFGMATSMACMLGTFLIGLTYIQIKFLSRVEYKRAAD